MAQPAVKRTPLGIDAFWDKPTHDPPLRWEKWRVQYKLALLSKENIILDTLLGPKTDMVDLPLEPKYEEIKSALPHNRREKEECSQCATKDELAKQMPTSILSRHNVWRQTVATCVSQNHFSTVSKHLGGRTSHSQLQKTAYHD